MYETLQWNVSPNPPYLCLGVQSSIRHSSEPVRVWESVLTETCINTLKHWIDTPGDVVYYPSLPLTCWEPPDTSVPPLSFPKGGQMVFRFPGPPPRLVTRSPCGVGTLWLCVRAHLCTQGTRALRGLRHERVRAESWAKETPSWRERQHETGRTNSPIHSWYLSVTISNARQSQPNHIPMKSALDLSGGVAACPKPPAKFSPF